LQLSVLALAASEQRRQDMIEGGAGVSKGVASCTTGGSLPQRLDEMILANLNKGEVAQQFTLLLQQMQILPKVQQR